MDWWSWNPFRRIDVVSFDFITLDQHSKGRMMCKQKSQVIVQWGNFTPPPLARVTHSESGGGLVLNSPAWSWGKAKIKGSRGSQRTRCFCNAQNCINTIYFSILFWPLCQSVLLLLALVQQSNLANFTPFSVFRSDFMATQLINTMFKSSRGTH